MTCELTGCRIHRVGDGPGTCWDCGQEYPSHDLEVYVWGAEPLTAPVDLTALVSGWSSASSQPTGVLTETWPCYAPNAHDGHLWTFADDHPLMRCPGVDGSS